ncbi:MAG: 3-keto-disaccharide hydrolase [Planctomycetota bacterium]|jgi:hypothetical protein
MIALDPRRLGRMPAAAVLLPLVLGFGACQVPTTPPPLHGAEDSAWFLVGGATFLHEDDDVIHGIGRDLPRNSFLVSRETYADFELEVELRIDGGNSGIQVRSAVDPEAARVVGYQIEVDPSERAWSGGLYDEGRRGWLDPNEGKEEARAAFDPAGWNHYRIRCEGDRIQSWVNGVPCADWRDDMDAEGHVALQVHGGAKTDVWWRGLRIERLGATAD